MKKGIKLMLISTILLISGGLIIGGIKVTIYSQTKEKIISIEQAEHREFAIIPGAKIHQNSPSLHLKDRLECGIRLYKENKVKKIILSGGYDKGVEKMETEVMYNYLIENNIPKDIIFIDNYGINTYNTMLRTKEFISNETTYICTQEMYSYRTQYLANNVGLNAITIKADLKQYNLNPMLYLREFLAPTKAFIESKLLKIKPKYSLKEKEIFQKK